MKEQAESQKVIQEELDLLPPLPVYPLYLSTPPTAHRFKGWSGSSSGASFLQILLPQEVLRVGMTCIQKR